MGDEVAARGLDIGDDQVETAGRAGRRRGHVRPELNRATRPRRCELDDSEPVIEWKVGVEPPPQTPVELLRPLDVRDGDDDYLELQLDAPGPRAPTRVAAADLSYVHLRPPSVGDTTTRRDMA